MRKTMIAALAAVALGMGAVTTAVAAPHGGGGGHFGGGGGGGAHIGGFGAGGGVHMGGLGGGHLGGGDHFGGLGKGGPIGGMSHGTIGGAGPSNFAAMRGSAPSDFAAQTAHAGRGPAFAERGRHDRDHGRHRSFAFGPGYGGLYDYDGNWPYCNNGLPYYYDYNSCSDSNWND